MVFCDNKKNKRWFWYASEPRYQQIITHAFGQQNVETLQVLLACLSRFDIKLYYTDQFIVYTYTISKEKHVVGKYVTQPIERATLTFRSRLKQLVSK